MSPKIKQGSFSCILYRQNRWTDFGFNMWDNWREWMDQYQSRNRNLKVKSICYKFKFKFPIFWNKPSRFILHIIKCNNLTLELNRTQINYVKENYEKCKYYIFEILQFTRSWRKKIILWSKENRLRERWRKFMVRTFWIVLRSSYKS